MSAITMSSRMGYVYTGSHLGGIGEVLREFGRAHNDGKAINRKYGLPVAEALLKQLRDKDEPQKHSTTLMLAHNPRKYELAAPQALQGSAIDLFHTNRQNGSYSGGYYMDIHAYNNALTETGDRTDPSTSPKFLGRPLGLRGVDVSLGIASATEDSAPRILKFDRFAEALRTYASAHPELRLPDLYTNKDRIVSHLFFQSIHGVKTNNDTRSIGRGLNLSFSFDGWIDTTIPYKGYRPTDIKLKPKHPLDQSADKFVLSLQPDKDIPAWYGEEQDYALMLGAALTAALSDVELLQT